MASINQLVSEIAHSVGEPNNYALRRNLQLIIIHERNEKIRQSHEKHGYIDRSLTQRFRVEVIDVPDGDMFGSEVLALKTIKRTKSKPPKPLRFNNSLPFMSIRTSGYNNVVIPFVREDRIRFFKNLQGMCRQSGYDYINGYIYIWAIGDTEVDEISSIIIDGVFEQPQLIPIETNDDIEHLDTFDDEYLLSEDMIESIKETIFKRNLLGISREVNEVNVQPKTITNGGGQQQQQG